MNIWIVAVGDPSLIDKDKRLIVTIRKIDLALSIKKMCEQEKKHLETFNKILIKRGIRPTALSPFWDLGGYLLGVTSALIDRKAAMACTVAVEEVIEEHYKEQENVLKKDNTEKELIKIIKKFREEEIEHKDIALEHNAEDIKGYQLITKGNHILFKEIPHSYLLFGVVM